MFMVMVMITVLFPCKTKETLQTDEYDHVFLLQITVSNHDIRNISYITQDPEDRRVFAYIAKDAKTDKHYCHVFRMDSIVSRFP